MTRGTIKLSKPVYNIELDFDEHSLEANGFVRVIRCEECKKWKTLHCPVYAKYVTVMPNKSQYCSWAERKEE